MIKLLLALLRFALLKWTRHYKAKIQVVRGQILRGMTAGVRSHPVRLGVQWGHSDNFRIGLFTKHQKWWVPLSKPDRFINWCCSLNWSLSLCYYCFLVSLICRQSLQWWRRARPGGTFRIPCGSAVSRRTVRSQKIGPSSDPTSLIGCCPTDSKSSKSNSWPVTA